jgi:hypothetical protein
MRRYLRPDAVPQERLQQFQLSDLESIGHGFLYATAIVDLRLPIELVLPLAANLAHEHEAHTGFPTGASCEDRRLLIANRQF